MEESELTPQTEICGLPNELLLQVFSLLMLDEASGDRRDADFRVQESSTGTKEGARSSLLCGQAAISRAAPVCKAFRQTASQEALWERVAAVCSFKQMQGVLAVPSRTAAIRSLRLCLDRGCGRIERGLNDDFLAALQSECVSLEELVLAGSWSQPTALVKPCITLAALRELSIAGAPLLSQLVLDTPKLQKLELHNCASMRILTFGASASCLELQHLSICNVGRMTASLAELFVRVGHQLRSITMGMTKDSWRRPTSPWSTPDFLGLMPTGYDQVPCCLPPLCVTEGLLRKIGDHCQYLESLSLHGSVNLLSPCLTLDSLSTLVRLPQLKHLGVEYFTEPGYTAVTSVISVGFAGAEVVAFQAQGPKFTSLQQARLALPLRSRTIVEDLMGFLSAAPRLRSLEVVNCTNQPPLEFEALEEAVRSSCPLLDTFRPIGDLGFSATCLVQG